MQKNRKQKLTNDLILTGIPRSGTSYLCGLLHELKNCVVINEPDRMSGLLRKSQLPNAALDFHLSTRDAILQKKMIQNKLHNGELIEDTAIVEKYETYQPEVRSADFLLCSKNTLGYIARLEGFQKLIPDTPIIACIRNPVDTIASWKKSFSHLETASASTQHIIGALNDDYISDWQRERLLEISKESRVAYKRAMFWAYLADWLWKNKAGLNIVYYENIVTDPENELLRIFNKTNNTFDFSLKRKVAASAIRTNKRSLLTDEDRNAIKNCCFPAAKKFSYPSSF